MKLHIDEQVLTAYALDELPIQQRIEVKAYLAAHPEAAAEVEAIRATASQLTADLSAEAASFGSITKPVVSEQPMRIRRSRRVEAMLAIAASVALIGGAAVVLIRATAERSASQPLVVLTQPLSTESGQFAPTTQPQQNPAPTLTVAQPKVPSIVSSPDASEVGKMSGDSRLRVETRHDIRDLVKDGPDFKAPPNFNLSSNSAATPTPTDRSALTVTAGAPHGQIAEPAKPQQTLVLGAGSVLTDAQRQSGISSRRFKGTFEATDEGIRFGELGRPAPGDVAKAQLAEREHNTESYDRIVDNAFLNAEQNPLSTFSIDVDTASYSNLRRFLTQGQLPPKDAVRIEEMINYFPYRYEGPAKDGKGDGDKPFASSVEVAGCPWAPSHRLVRVAIKGMEIAPKDRPASNLVFLIDVSGSMNQPNKLPLVKESLRKLVNQLDARDRVAMIVYAGQSGLVLPSTSVGEVIALPARERGDDGGPAPHGRAIQNGRQQILDAIDRLESGGSTNGGAGIELAYLTAQSGFIKDGINRVILATDGDFNVGVTDQGSLTRLIEDKAKGGTFLSVLGFGMGNTKDSTMEKLADKGNGNYAYIDTAKEAQKVLVEQMSGTLVTIAKDVKIQVEFNPGFVGSYRLIGYENRMLAKEDFNNDKKDAGEIGAGHTVTALYEVTPLSELTARPAVDPLKYQAKPEEARKLASNELLTLKIRYKAPDAPLEQGTSKLLEFPIVDEGKGYEKASEDFKFAAAVASFGMILRNSEYKGTSSYDAAIEMAMEGKGLDANGHRAELIELIKKAKAIGAQ